MKMKLLTKIALVASITYSALAAAETAPSVPVTVSYTFPADGPLPRTYRVTLAITAPDNPDWIVSTFVAGAEQPIRFATPKLFIDRPSGNSFYTSSTQVSGKCVLWYNDQKRYLLGKVIDESWLAGMPPLRVSSSLAEAQHPNSKGA